MFNNKEKKYDYSLLKEIITIDEMINEFKLANDEKNIVIIKEIKKKFVNNEKIIIEKNIYDECEEGILHITNYGRIIKHLVMLEMEPLNFNIEYISHDFWIPLDYIELINKLIVKIDDFDNINHILISMKSVLENNK